MLVLQATTIPHTMNALTSTKIHIYIFLKKCIKIGNKKVHTSVKYLKANDELFFYKHEFSLLL